MVIFIFLKFGMVKVFEILQTISYMKMNIFQIKLFNEITLLLKLVMVAEWIAHLLIVQEVFQSNLGILPLLHM